MAFQVGTGGDGFIGSMIEEPGFGKVLGCSRFLRDGPDIVGESGGREPPFHDVKSPACGFQPGRLLQAGRFAEQGGAFGVGDEVVVSAAPILPEYGGVEVGTPCGNGFEAGATEEVGERLFREVIDVLRQDVSVARAEQSDGE